MGVINYTKKIQDKIECGFGVTVEDILDDLEDIDSKVVMINRNGMWYFYEPSDIDTISGKDLESQVKKFETLHDRKNGLCLNMWI